MTTAPCPMCGQGRLPVQCVCGHGVYSHDINRKGERTACSTSSGPKGVRCPCKRYEATEEQP